MRANWAGDQLLGLMDLTLQLCALSTLHQPRRGSTNATYLSKDPRYGRDISTMSWYPADGLPRHTGVVLVKWG